MHANYQAQPPHLLQKLHPEDNWCIPPENKVTTQTWVQQRCGSTLPGFYLTVHAEQRNNYTRIVKEMFAFDTANLRPPAATCLDLHALPSQRQQAAHHGYVPSFPSQYDLEASPFNHTAPGHPDGCAAPFIDSGAAAQSWGATLPSFSVHALPSHWQQADHHGYRPCFPSQYDCEATPFDHTAP